MTATSPRALGPLSATLGAAVLAAAVRRSRRDATTGDTIRAAATVTINRPRPDVYRYWHDFTRLPTFMAHLQSVESLGDGRTRWTASGPAGRRVRWDAEVLEDVPSERISWRSIGAAPVAHRGTVRFAVAPQAQGTEVRVELAYSPPGGDIGSAVAALFGEEPNQQLRDDLRRFKQVLETGEVVRSAGSPSGAMTRRQFRQRPAQPHATGEATS